MTAGLHDGWDLAAYALGFLLGATPVLLVLAVTILGWPTVDSWIVRKLTARRLRRAAARSGRGITALDLNAAEQRGRKRVDDALSRARARS